MTDSPGSPATVVDEPDDLLGAVLPNKLFFKIGEASEIVAVAPHVLRYWEREFSFIRPYKSASRHRRYRRKDIELFLDIKRLLYTEMYTVAGARKYLQERLREQKDQPPQPDKSKCSVSAEHLAQARGLVHEIIDLVS